MRPERLFRTRVLLLGCLVGLGAMSNPAEIRAEQTFSLQPIATAGNIGGQNSLALDAQLIPHITFYDMDSGTLRHAVPGPSGWQIEIIDTTGTPGASQEQYNSTAIGGDGTVHVVYYDYADMKFMYAHRDGSGWSREVIDSGQWVGLTNSMALDTSGRPHVSYGYGALKYARRDLSGWTIEPVPGASNSVGSTSIAFDPLGEPHVAYSVTFHPDRLYYASRNAGSWTTELVDASPGQSVGEACALAFDGVGTPHISYHDNQRLALKYAERQGSTWSTQDLNQPFEGGQYTSIAVDGLGDVHVSYTAFSPKFRVSYAKRTSGQWSTCGVDSSFGGAAGMYTHLVLDPSGRPWISYFNQSENTLVKLAEPAAVVAVKPVVEDAPKLRLEGIQPNPARGAFIVAFSLEGNGPAWLEVVDVAGRRVVRNDLGRLGAGRHSLRSGNLAPLASGVYVVRLTEAGRSVSRTVTVVR